jgi:DNA-directed RNA polymerase II subunit RPB1
MSESINDDDLTISYCEIIKLNNCLSATMTDLKLQKCIDMLAFRIKTLFDNTGGKAKHTSTKPFKGFKERLSGKDGLIRNNLMGKRVNFSARTVIGPDPTLELDQIAVPEDICSILSYAENVNSFNRKHLQEMIWKKQVNMIDRIMPDGQLRRIHIKFALSNPNTDLRDELCTIKNGDIVHRQIQTGDIVLLNRQPTLHRGSMLAKRIIRRKTKTICMNLATTSTFNADFDGDEMNLFFPQNEMSKSELKLLSSTPNNMMGAQSSQSVISIVQDALLSLFLMTKSTEQIPKSDFFQLLFPCNLSWKHIDRKLNQMQCEGYNAFTGKGLFSMILPFDLEYTSYNKADIHEPTVVIQKGLLVSGVLNKMNLKGGHSSLICLFHKYYSKEIACDFVNQSQFLAIAYITRRGFSIGIGDTLTQTESRQLPVVIEKCFFEASEYEKSIHNERVKEAKINLALSKAKDIGMKLATDALGNENNFIQTVRAGSKGDYFNIAQIMGLVGQQNIGGSRIRPQLNQGKRTLPHYFFQEEDLTRKYESRGFIRNSFLKGLSPQEFWFHAMSGREGITDTAMKTAQSGYTQRKMVKIMEDVQVKYDQTVRNSFGSIIQFAYGGDNLCPTKMVLVQDEMNDKKPFFCDVSKLADRLNCD